METLTINLGDRSYPILIGEDTLPQLPAILDQLSVSGKVGVVTDTNVGPLYGDRVLNSIDRTGRDAALCVIPAGEHYKRLATIEGICTDFVRAGLDRGSVIMALGGGVVGDVAGFAAAVFMRGIRFIQVPTTIVAQVDSSVGGKTGVSLPEGKNMIGAFHQPSAVVIDLTMLRTLPDRELRAGIAEVIKHGVIADDALFAYMEQSADAIVAKDLNALIYLIRRSCEIKGAIVEADEREQGLRANLNYGHTFGHAIETVSQYAFLHGEAVALGMCAAATLARELGMVSPDFVTRQKNCIQKYGLPTSWQEIPVDDVLEVMHHDKKAKSGKLKVVLPTRFGEVIHRSDITREQLRTALEAIRYS